MAGFAYRGDYDLSKHEEYSDDRFTIFKQYDEPKTVERATVDPDMSYLGPEFGGDAQAVVSELETLAARDRAAFEGDTIEIGLEGESHEIPVAKTGFAVEEQTEAGEHITPHVVEPSFGVDRLVYTVLHHGYREDEVSGEERTYLELEPEVAPTFVGVFPLQSDDELVAYADEIVADLRDAGLSVTYDDSGNIGRRYRRQDEVGTPFCVTVDYETVEETETTVTVRERDTTDQSASPSTTSRRRCRRFEPARWPSRSCSRLEWGCHRLVNRRTGSILVPYQFGRAVSIPAAQRARCNSTTNTAPSGSLSSTQTSPPYLSTRVSTRYSPIRCPHSRVLFAFPEDRLFLFVRNPGPSSAT